MKIAFRNPALPLLAVTAVALVSIGISGGPFGGGSTSSSVVGTYAGVLHPGCVCSVTEGGETRKIKCSDLENYSPDVRSKVCPETCGENALGVFALAVPETDIGTGTFVMFAQGRVFDGTIRGTADPGLSTLSAVLDATFNFTVTVPVPTPPPNPSPQASPTPTATPGLTTISVTASATGSMTAKITNKNSASSVGITDRRLRGNAELSISQGQVQGGDFNNDGIPDDLTPVITCDIPMRVIGFRQSSAAPTGSG